MPRNHDIKKVLVIGSGPIVIGQAAEFDYAGTQACRSLKEEGVEVVLVNSNPATIMTDKDIADQVYIEPLTVSVLEKIIAKEKPDAVLCIGQAGGRYDITPERVAINLDDARIKDNEGNQPIDVTIFEDGAPAYFATLPIKAMVQNMRNAGLPASVSNTAGTFVCNHLMYGVLYTLAKSYPGVRGGFMHVPFIPSQVVNRPAAPSMNLQDIARGIEAAIAAIGENESDIVAAEGATH